MNPLAITGESGGRNDQSSLMNGEVKQLRNTVCDPVDRPSTSNGTLQVKFKSI